MTISHHRFENASTNPLAITTFPWQTPAGQWILTIAVKATFSLRHGQEATLAPHQTPIHHDIYWDNNPHAGLYAPTDLVPFKPRADILLVGNACAPAGVAAASLFVRLHVGDFSKALRVNGDRVWTRTPEGLRPGPSRPFKEMPLRYERALLRGDNPIGITLSHAAIREGAPLPNIEPTDELNPLATAGFGPLAPHLRAARARFSPVFLQWAQKPSRAQAPDAADFSFFNAAPRDQQVDLIHPGSTIEFENLHPAHPRFETRLPASTPKVSRVDPVLGPTEVTLRCDTLWIEPAREIAVVSWRGISIVAGPEEHQWGQLSVSMVAAAQENYADGLESTAEVAAASGPEITLVAPLVPPRPATPFVPSPNPPQIPPPTAAPSPPPEQAPPPPSEGAITLTGALIQPALVLPFATNDAASPPPLAGDSDAEVPLFPREPPPLIQEPPLVSLPLESTPLPAPLPLPPEPPPLLTAPPPKAQEPATESPAQDTFDAPPATFKSAPPAAGAAPPEPAFDPATISLEQCAALAAAMERRPDQEAAILSRHGLSSSEWSEVERRWSAAISAEIDRNRTALLGAYDAAYVAELERARGVIQVVEYARIVVGAQGARSGDVLEDLGLPRGAKMRIQRVWMKRIAKDPALAASVRAALDAARED